MLYLQTPLENFLQVERPCYGYVKHYPRSGKYSARRKMFIRCTNRKIFADTTFYPPPQAGFKITALIWWTLKISIFWSVNPFSHLLEQAQQAKMSFFVITKLASMTIKFQKMTEKSKFFHFLKDILLSCPQAYFEHSGTIRTLRNEKSNFFGPKNV